MHRSHQSPFDLAAALLLFSVGFGIGFAIAVGIAMYP